jgi:Uma2 family endonuclease
VIEVLSPSTEATDRTDKFDFYLGCPSLEEYVMVSQNRAKVQTVFRQPDGTWSLAFFEGISAIARLRSLGVDLPLAEVYAKVELPAPPSEI